MEENDIMFLKLSFDIIPIIEILKKNDWIVSNFDAEISDIYDPNNYLYNKYIEGVDYNLVIDRNIFHYIINSKIKSNECHKTAIALIIFCQVSEILIEPNLAIYEKINYDGTIADEAINELKQFYEIDGVYNDSLYDFVTGKINKIKINSNKEIDKNNYKEQLLKYNRLTEWQSMYLYILKIVSLFYTNSGKEIKLVEFSKWMIKFYRKSLPAFVYSAFLFSNNPPKKIMKYDKKLSILERNNWII